MSHGKNNSLSDRTGLKAVISRTGIERHSCLISQTKLQSHKGSEKAASKQINLLLEIAACIVNDAEDCRDYYLQLVQVSFNFVNAQSNERLQRCTKIATFLKMLIPYKKHVEYLFEYLCTEELYIFCLCVSYLFRAFP